ncbi:MAG: hypothetical protein V1907_04235 [Candidatus Kerfeldbacteria bacterium]
MLIMIVGGLAVFLFTISPYPAGDDPGYHTSVVKYLMLERNIRFTMPFFPQLGQLWGSERFVTPVFLAAFGTLSGYTDVFRMTIAFAALCIALALIPLYLLVADWLKSRPVAILAIAYLAFSKFYLENFFEGSYEQMTGLLLVSWVLYAQYRWIATRNDRWLVLSLGLTGMLVKTHELGFLVALLYVAVTSVYAVGQRWGAKWRAIALVVVTAGFGTVFALRPAYFAANAIQYGIRPMLSTGEGTPTIALVAVGIGTIIFLVRRFRFELFAYLAIAFMLSQSAYLGSMFYPFRFNVYFMQGVAILFAVFVHSVVQLGRRSGNRLIVPSLVIAMWAFMVVPQVLHVRGLGLWITGQEKNPASVILDDDVSMYQWIAGNTPKTSVIAATFKWGYYLPAIAERAVVMDTAVGGDSRDARYQLAGQVGTLFVTTSAADAAARAKALGVQYVYWDASFARYGTGYSRAKFNDTKYFKEVHRINEASLYEVL